MISVASHRAASFCNDYLRQQYASAMVEGSWYAEAQLLAPLMLHGRHGERLH